jgi:hypothetical protein
MPNCQTCGVAMGASERTKNHRGVAGNWHIDCELQEHVRDDGAPAVGDAGWRVLVVASLARLTARKTSQAATPTAALTATIAAGAGLTNGIYTYRYTNVSISGESLPGPVSANMTAAGGNQQGNLTAVAVGPSGTTKRKVYRTQSGGSVYTLLTTINDNTTTTFTDNATDASIVAAANPPVFTTFTAGDFP